ncbi:unnamed protein product, partial [Staurois parvus]
QVGSRCVSPPPSTPGRPSSACRSARSSPARRKVPIPDRPLTQEELLEEAKITEEINIRSLGIGSLMRADKKKHVQKKRRCVGPTVRYHSATMPLITELNVKEENVDVEGLKKKNNCSFRLEHEQMGDSSTGPPASKCSRTFITFSDDEAFERIFPKSKAKMPVREVCPVTHKPAQYRDPITDIPYYNARGPSRSSARRTRNTSPLTALPNAAMGRRHGSGRRCVRRRTTQHTAEDRYQTERSGYIRPRCCHGHLWGGEGQSDDPNDHWGTFTFFFVFFFFYFGNLNENL